VYIPPTLPPGVCTGLYIPSCTAVPCTVVQDFKEERHLCAERCPFSLQNKPLKPRETLQKGKETRYRKHF